MYLKKPGKIVRDEWLSTTNVRKNIFIDEFVIMPNHFHAIVLITENISKNVLCNSVLHYAITKNKIDFKSPSNTLGSVIRGFKGATTKQINLLRNDSSKSVWHRNYFDRVIRYEKEYNAIREYINYNPLYWEWEKDNPEILDFKMIKNINK